ncbi:MAG: hypothetical protein FWD52_09180 [Candidatus Bathyarchaeota archaeon]|jgi:uncharacterized protein YwgA|nr:hypothetical protein [Candidatus Termitimicrobium sp.]MCL2643656.1 hypothetical protein [Candidatus Termiticorpusculum sp.]
MSLQYNKNIILNVLEQQSGLGKTAVMKIIYMLQQVKKMDMGYDFTIYAYGPYSAGVIEDIDDLIEKSLVDSQVYEYANYIGYNLNLTALGKTKLAKLVTNDERKIKDILSFAGEKQAKELELFSTIIFIENQYAKNQWEREQKDIVDKVAEIKPHFNKEKISTAYTTLLENKYIKS